RVPADGLVLGELLYETYGGRMQVARLSRLHDLAREIVGDDLAQPARRGEQLVEIDAGAVAHRLEHVHQVLGADVAGRAGRERASERGRERAGDRDVRSLQLAHDLAEAFEGSRGRAAHVGTVVRLRDRHDENDFVDAGGDRALGAPDVGDQGDIAHRRIAPDP